MRFLSAQWVGLLEGGAWLRHATHANAVAAYLEGKLRWRPCRGSRWRSPGRPMPCSHCCPRQQPNAVAARGWRFYNDVGPGGAARLMCSWDSTEADVDAFVGDLQKALTAV